MHCCHSCWKTYRLLPAATIVDRITCEIAAGPRTVILGPNGAGKSVLMRLCHGLLAADLRPRAVAAVASGAAVAHRRWCFSGR